METIAKMRTEKQAFKELKALDPHTNVNQYTMRQIYLSGNVPTIRVGKLRLMDFDLLMATSENLLQKQSKNGIIGKKQGVKKCNYL